ncbi:hypothetical protein Scep_020067 [Stephania cephalantha]|uniref:Small auxin up regulated protein n=1 Tax=Stephania cephalantha TaxID=152367 RepID=A0AAP0ICE8_9MAGN
MIKTKRLVGVATKWRRAAEIGKRRTLMPSSRNSTTSTNNTTTDKGHFVVYTTDKRRFVIPLKYLHSNVFKELLRMSEEEFGLPSDGPITLPCRSVFMEFVMLFVLGRKGLERALIAYLCSTSRCSSSALAHQDERQQVLLHGF